jgi:SNF2 Helicase protein
LRVYAGARNRERLLSLLMPVQRVAEHCPWLRAMVDAGEIYHPLRWRPAEAMQLLKDVPQLESAGVIVRMPTSWRMNRPARPQVKATVGATAPSKLGLDALLDFDLNVVLDGETLTAAEVKALLQQTDGLALIRGKWVEVDRERLSLTLAQFEEIERRAADGGLSFGEPRPQALLRSRNIVEVSDRFAGSDAGGHRAAAAYTLIETCMCGWPPRCKSFV